MADGGSRFSRVLSVLAIVVLKCVTSNEGEFDNVIYDDGNNFDGFEALYRRFHNEFYAPAYPVENSFWRSPENLGEVSGVAVDLTGNVVIFHRGDRTWNYGTFNDNAEYQENYRGPIRDNTVLTLNPKTGEVVHGWGNQTFYLPHGIHIDPYGNVWLTDIALHQVFKFSASGEPQLVLGQRFEPGNDNEHFCQPTSVAVLPSGEIVVADGYCNNRLVLFDGRGNPKYTIDERLGWITLRVPHSLTILPNRQVCVADRENWRIVCLDVTFSGFSQNLEPPYSIRHRQFGRIFGIASYHGFIYAVNGMTSNIPIKGFTIDPVNQNITGIWGPESSSFKMPHAIAICPYGKALYVSEIGPNKIWKFDLVTKSN
ncbi:hypothetical protein PUN28_015995 [Cardiocondyla obscurior]|uniref:peptidylamidoglycolate lyase n=1 Tax=Cardiocondyla obscurior TaxID=286306 RepID=A0AAW2ERM2_9HYME